VVEAKKDKVCAVTSVVVSKRGSVEHDAICAGARSGGGPRPYFEGGQTPMYKRMRKYGFSNKQLRDVGCRSALTVELTQIWNAL
jgi:ribosomal protein L15